MPPPLLCLANEADYRAHFLGKYCNAPRTTRDGIPVHFLERHFGHAFFESANRSKGDKSVFSRERAERIEWIGEALADPSAELFVGWNQKKGAHDPSRRVTVVFEDYLVVLQVVERKALAYFTTAFVAGPRTLAMVRSGPLWGGIWKP